MRHLINTAIACFLCFWIFHAFRMGGIEAEAFDFIGRLATAIIVVKAVDSLNPETRSKKGG